MGGLSAWQGLFVHGRLQAGERVLITGASGGVGHLAVQLARHAGAEVVEEGAADLLFDTVGGELPAAGTGRHDHSGGAGRRLFHRRAGSRAAARSWRAWRTRGSCCLRSTRRSRSSAHGRHSTALRRGASAARWSSMSPPVSRRSQRRGLAAACLSNEHATSRCDNRRDRETEARQPAASTSPRSASAAWGCPTPTGTPTRPSRSRRSTTRSTSASTSSTPPTSTARTRTRSSSAARSAAGATRSSSRRSSASCATRRSGDGARSTAGPSTCARRARRACARLGVDTIDLYYQHRVDPRRADRGDGRRDGRAGRRRARCATSGSRRPAPTRSGARRAVHPIAALQSEYSLWTREPEDGVLARPAASSASASCRTARSAAASSPGDPLAGGLFAETTTAATLPRSRARTSDATLGSSRRWRRLAQRQGAHAGAARARVGARAGRRRRADPRDEARDLPRGERRRGRRPAVDVELALLDRTSRPTLSPARTPGSPTRPWRRTPPDTTRSALDDAGRAQGQRRAHGSTSIRARRCCTCCATSSA